MTAGPEIDGVAERLRRASDLYYAEPATALALADEAMALLDDDAPADRRAWALLVRGSALSYCGRFEDAVPTLQQALATVPAAAPARRVQILRALSIAFGDVAARDAALDWAVQASDLARSLDEPALLADTLLTVAVAVSEAGDVASGTRYFEEVLALYEGLGNRDGAVSVLNNLGINAKKLGRYEEALQYARRTVQMADAAGRPDTAAVAASNLPESLLRLGRPDEAREALIDAVERASRFGYARAEIFARLQLGEFLLSQGETAPAQVELERVLAMLSTSGHDKYLPRVHQALSALHKQGGRFEEALRHHEAFHEAERRQFDEASARRMRGLQVQFELARAQQEAQRARAEAAELAAQSRTDALTGLPNRRQLDERLADEVARAQRLRHPLALAMIDLDHFKQVNDRLGHGVGDAVLRTVATLLRQHSRGVDLVARFGGEEFCWLLIEADASAARLACEASCAAIAAHGWARIAPDLRVTLSMGVASLRADGDAPSLLDAADRALYAAKRGGRNRVVVDGDPV